MKIGGSGANHANQRQLGAYVRANDRPNPGANLGRPRPRQLHVRVRDIGNG